jgi:tripartite-type tricarboxylate transporter receptor subunit TctC
MNRREYCRMAGASILGAGLTPLAWAQAKWPDKPIRLAVPYTPGGGTDTLARLIEEKLGVAAKWTIVVENKPAACGRSP